MTHQRFFSAFLIGLTSLLLNPICSARAGQSPLGIWIDQSGRGAIEIRPCGDKLCGHLVWLKESENTEGCGAQIIGEARQVKEGLWDNGWIYSPEKNRRYDVELKPLPDGTLRVKGYAGSKIFSRTMIWRPAPSNLELCQNKKINSEETTKQEWRDSTSPEKLAKAESSMPIDGNRLTNSQSPTQKKNGLTLENEEKVLESPGLTINPSKKEGGKDPSSFDATKFRDKKIKTVQSDFAAGSMKEKLDDLQRETGFGIKKIGNGSCRLKVPFVTIRIRCDD